jgi:hypothetical protein
MEGGSAVDALPGNTATEEATNASTWPTQLLVADRRLWIDDSAAGTRISTETGVAETIESRGDGGLCAGALDADCDPVTAVVLDVNDSDCVLAAVGLVHMGMHFGGVARACARDVQAVQWAFDPDGSRQTALSGLARTKDGFWATSPEGVFHVRNAQVETFAHGTPATWCGARVWRPAPGVFEVDTTVNQRVSVSGPERLIAVE